MELKASHFKKAAKLIAGQKRLVRGRFGGMAEGQFCALGAVSTVAFGGIRPNAITCNVNSVLGDGGGNELYGYISGSALVTQFNDRRSTKQEDVVTLLLLISEMMKTGSL